MIALRGQISNARDLGFRNNEYMHRRNRGNVPECQAVLILVDDLCRYLALDNPSEEACHG